MPARPSVLEVREQLQQQLAHSCGAAEPFVSAICCPFDIGAATGDATSALNWIHISHPPEMGAHAPQDPLADGCRACVMEVTQLASLQTSFLSG